MKLTHYLPVTILFIATCLIHEIVAQFKVIRMESLDMDDGSMQKEQQQLQGKGKLLRDSNVTVIQVFPSERVNRRIDKNAKRKRVDTMAAESSDLEVFTITPQTNDGQFMKLHIINVRTGKIQDAIMLTTSNNHQHQQSSRRKAAPSSKSEISSRRIGASSGTKEIIRVKPLHSHRPETASWNEINSDKKFLPKPYKLRKTYKSNKCKCEDNSTVWNCKKIQISIAQCKSNQFMCCS